MRYLRSSIIALLLSALVLSVLPQRAQALTLSDVEDKDDDTLREENWETRDISTNTTQSVKCGLWSILISTFWRGYGHHCIHDESSHYKLLGMEGASLAMLAASATISSVSKDDKALSGIWKTLFHFGASIFISSYIFDVVGTFKGDAFQFADNHLDPYGQSLGVFIRWLPSDNFTLGAQIDYVYRNPRFWVNPYAFVDISQAINENVNLEAGVDFGVAVWYGENPHTYLAIAMDSKYSVYGNNDYMMLKFLPYIEFSLDLGSWFSHMANFRFINRLGLGAMLLDYKYANVDPFSDVSTVLALESELNLNLFKDLNLAFIYRYRPDYYVGQISSTSRIFNTLPVPGVGIFSLDLSFNISKGWLAELDINFGSNIDFWIGIIKHF